MKVLLISHTCQSAAEGQPRARHLGSHPDVELRVLVPDRWKHYGNWRTPQTPAADAPYKLITGKVSLPWAGPAQFYLHWYPRLASIQSEFQPDIIDVWEEPWAAVAAQACLLQKRLVPRAKLICETEQNILKKLPPPFEQFRRYVLNRTDACIARSEEAVDVLRAKGFNGPATVIPNGVDADRFRPMDRDACRSALGASGFVIGYVGRLLEEKGVADLLDAVAKFKTPVTVLFVGSGNMENELKTRAVAAGIADRIRLLPNQSHDQLPAIMNAMDCLVLPSRTTDRWKEQFGRVLIEAGACGIPVIGSSSGAIPSVINNAGIVFPEKDATALFNALQSLQLDPGHARQLGLAGRAQVEQHYTWQRVAEKMVEVYQQAISTTGINGTYASEPTDPKMLNQKAIGSFAG